MEGVEQVEECERKRDTHTHKKDTLFMEKCAKKNYRDACVHV